MTPEILTFEIDKIQSGVYRLVVTCGVELGEPSIYGSIEEAIREEALGIPESFAQFLEVRYHRLSSGTLRLSDAPGQAGVIADRLVALMAEMNQVATYK